MVACQRRIWKRCAGNLSLCLQDGQIGVYQDTMAMWSTMPTTHETQDWVVYMSNMLDIAV